MIDKKIENAVSRMQSVIELGRVIRDRKTLPIKVGPLHYNVYSSGSAPSYVLFSLLQYPLKEVVIIHQEAEALADIKSLDKYILEVRFNVL